MFVATCVRLALDKSVGPGSSVLSYLLNMDEET